MIGAAERERGALDTLPMLGLVLLASSCVRLGDEGCSVDTDCKGDRVCVDAVCVEPSPGDAGSGEGEGEGEQPGAPCISDDECGRDAACETPCVVQGECAFVTFPDATADDLVAAGFDERGCRAQGSDENACILCTNACASAAGTCSTDAECTSGFSCVAHEGGSTCERSLCTEDCQCGRSTHCDERTGSCVPGPSCDPLSCDVGSSCDECGVEIGACAPFVVTGLTQFQCSPSGTAVEGDRCDGRETRCEPGLLCLCDGGSFCDGTEGVCARFCDLAAGGPSCDPGIACHSLTDEVGFCAVGQCTTRGETCINDGDCPDNFVCSGPEPRCIRVACDDDCQCDAGQLCDEEQGQCTDIVCDPLACTLDSCDGCPADAPSCSAGFVDHSLFFCRPGTATAGDPCDGLDVRCGPGLFCDADNDGGRCAPYCRLAGGAPACDATSTCTALSDDVGFCHAS